MANHKKAQKHLMAAHAASKSGNAKLAQSHAFHAVKALAGQASADEPDADDASGDVREMAAQILRPPPKQPPAVGLMARLKTMHSTKGR